MTWRCTRHWPRIWAAVVVIGLMAVVGLVVIRVQEPRFGKEKFDLLHEGMTEAEVVAVLGCADGDYRPSVWKHPTWFVSPSDPIGFPQSERGRLLEEDLNAKDVEQWMEEDRPIPPSPHKVYRKSWWAREHGIDVTFDAHGRVIHYMLLSLVPPRPPHDVIRWVRWWLGW